MHKPPRFIAPAHAPWAGYAQVRRVLITTRSPWYSRAMAPRLFLLQAVPVPALNSRSTILHALWRKPRVPHNIGIFKVTGVPTHTPQCRRAKFNIRET